MALYRQVIFGGKLTGEVQNTETFETIPNDPDNARRQEYEAWITEGNEPDPPDATEA